MTHPWPPVPSLSLSLSLRLPAARSPQSQTDQAKSKTHQLDALDSSLRINIYNVFNSLAGQARACLCVWLTRKHMRSWRVCVCVRVCIWQCRLETVRDCKQQKHKLTSIHRVALPPPSRPGSATTAPTPIREKNQQGLVKP